MQASFRALLSGIIDYAGLFPPARLPMEQAIRNYARYRTQPEAWMLGRFICPASRLIELSPFVEALFTSGPALNTSALGRGGSLRDFREHLVADLNDIAAFRERHSERAVVDVFETLLPVDLPQSGVSTARAFLAELGGLFQEQQLAPYFEAALDAGWRTTLAELIPALPGGFKLRCGGQEAAAFPRPEVIAFALTECVRHGVRFKATAGLHHPISHPDREFPVTMYGFLNVFGAGVLAAARRLSEEQIRQIVEDTRATDFAFDDTAFRWKELAVPVYAIARARREQVIAFGSCSFDEPRDDLRALGLLD